MVLLAENEKPKLKLSIMFKKDGKIIKWLILACGSASKLHTDAQSSVIPSPLFGNISLSLSHILLLFALVENFFFVGDQKIEIFIDF